MVKTLVVGDSFVGPFELFSKIKKDIKVVKFKGATVKGVSKDDNENNKKIVKLIDEYGKNLDCIFFIFGNVDLHLSYYWTLIHNEKFDIENIINNYLKFIDKLNINKNTKIFIFNVYPSPIGDIDVIEQLVHYGTFEKKNRNKIKGKINELRESIKFENRFRRYKKFNDILREKCKNKYYFVDMENFLINKNGKVKNKFLDQSKFNIHLLWQPQLNIYNKIT